MKKIFLVLLFSLVTRAYAHSGYGGVSLSADSVFTDKGFAAVSFQGLLALAWIDVGVEANAITNPDRLNPGSNAAMNTVIGFNIYGIIYINYITSRHWEIALNVPVAFFRIKDFIKKDPVTFLGVRLAVDLPNVADLEYRYRAGASFNFFTGPGVERFH